ncbi:hypothetical protein L7F22_031963 [Adiantum nelumboides]|nr:hypothetical protein [Adiantum nelumboides]
MACHLHQFMTINKLQLALILLAFILPRQLAALGSSAEFHWRRGNVSTTEEMQFWGTFGHKVNNIPNILGCSVNSTFIDNNTTTADIVEADSWWRLNSPPLGPPANATYSCYFIHNTASTKTIIDCAGQLVASPHPNISSPSSSSDGLHDDSASTSASYSFLGSNSCSFNAITTSSSSSSSAQLLHLHYHTTSHCINTTASQSPSSSITTDITAAPSITARFQRCPTSTFSCSVFTIVRSSDSPAGPPLFTSNDTALCTTLYTGNDFDVAVEYDLKLCFLNTSTNTLPQYHKDAFANYGVMFPFMFSSYL